ncbi:MAG: hypothetical protein ACYC09_00735 [Bacteroidota bacterium]
MMNPKERMHQTIENMIGDLLKMQDLVIQLSRETHELHVAKEHEEKHRLMKEQITQLQSRMETVKEFLATVNSRPLIPGAKMTEVDIAS